MNTENKAPQEQAPIQSGIPPVAGFIIDKIERAIHDAKNPKSMHTNGPCIAHIEVTCLERLLRAHLAAVPAAQQQAQSGWCVERGPASAPYYLHVYGGMLAWTPDHSQALRFSRRADAEQITEIVEDAGRIAEHVWQNEGASK
jgi:hypothetical protein